jgi:chromosome segregation ATPase
VSTIIETDLKEILVRFEQRFDKIDNKLEALNDKVDEKLEDFNNKIDQKLEALNDLRVEVATLTTKFEALQEDIQEIKGSQRAQIWTLIGILITAVFGFLVAIGKYAFFSNP